MPVIPLTQLPDGAWRLAPLVHLHWRRWDAEWLVFDAGSGLTHALDPLTAMSLMVLEGGDNASQAQVQASIVRELELDPGEADELVNARLGDILASLHRMGLVESLSSP